MITGIFAGITWALETIVIAIALSLTPFVSSSDGVFLAPFVSTFLHDTFSAVYMWIFSGLRRETKNIFDICKISDFKWIVLASAIGGPIGMTGYVLAVNYMGSSIGAIASAVYPAIGSVLAYLFLKEKIKWYQWIFLILTLVGVLGISYSPELNIKNFWIGLLGAFMCAFGWGTEGVILSKCLKNIKMKSEYALSIRQTVSALIYGGVIITALGGWKFVINLFRHDHSLVFLVIMLASLFATISYLLYYKTIEKKGAAKAMGLNITYTAWAMFFSIILLRDYSLLNPTTLIFGLMVVVCGILSGTDIKSLVGKRE